MRFLSFVFSVRPILVMEVILLGVALTTPSAQAVDVFVTAAVGQPFGVATVELPLDGPMFGKTFPPLRISDADGRVLYPVANDLIATGRPSDRPIPQAGGGRLLNRLGSLIREIAEGDQPLEQTVARRVSFLFLGSAPLNVTISDDRGEIGTYPITPKQDPKIHASVLQAWWDGYTESARKQVDASDHPSLVELYLVAMLASRTGMPLPDWYADTQEEDDQLLSTLKIIGGAEGVSDSVFRLAASGRQPLELPSEPLPASPRWVPKDTPGDLEGVEVEPIAARVPPECFYIRYGSFENFLWFQDLSAEYGGDITRMITLRGIANDGAARVETQLHMKMTQMARMLGGTVIEDQALIGRDLFLTDGASMGVLIKAKNAFLLGTSVAADRASLAKQDETVTLKNMKIAGRDVSFLSSGDNRVRSYLTQDGDYLFVSNSRELTERFIEVGESKKSLSSTREFRLARKLMPLERNDTIFAYVSPAMLRGLVSPEYLIELRRRLFAKADIALVQLARLAGANESNQPEGSLGIDPLMRSGFLPSEFGVRADGSGVFALRDTVLDTKRGHRGFFLPIADVEITAVTPAESAWYQEIAEQYSTRFPTMDPIMAGIQREPADPMTGIEKVSVHAEIAPFDPGKYGKYAKQLGPPTKVAMQFAPDDIIAVQAHVASDSLGPPTHLFAAVKDTVPPRPEQFDGILKAYFSLRQIPGYLGAWPQPSTLDRLPLGLGRGQPIGPGMSRLFGGLYRYTDGKFSILSFQEEVISSSLPFMAAIDVQDTAQIRANIGNLNGSKIEGWVNDQLYERARGGSVATANFMDLIVEQFRVPPDQVPDAVQRILGAEVQCTLGGEYEYSAEAGHWISTAWNGTQAPTTAPAGYVAPAMKWFRGATASVTQLDDRLLADAVLELERQ
ncbi:MAG: hypothetical protein ACR2NZ_09240 [Rubripirellula sp.]